jgi:hypothetical protein
LRRFVYFLGVRRRRDPRRIGPIGLVGLFDFHEAIVGELNQDLPAHLVVWCNGQFDAFERELDRVQWITGDCPLRGENGATAKRQG